jgi:hypothetical protein
MLIVLGLMGFVQRNLFPCFHSAGMGATRCLRLSSLPLAELARWFSIGANEISRIISIGYLTVFFFFTNLALRAMRKRLIQ